MKIFLANYEYKPQCGGAGFATYNLAKEFRKMGHEVTLLIGWDYSFGTPELIEGVDTHVVRLKKKSIHESAPLGILAFTVKALPIIHRITKNKDLDIIQFYFSIPTGILKYGISGKCPYICSLRGGDVPDFHKDKYKLVRNLVNFINADIVKHAAAVLALSNDLKNCFQKFQPGIPVSVIPNGINMEYYTNKREYPVSIRRIVTVARLISVKRLDLLLEAMIIIHQKYGDVTLDIYGEGFQRKDLEAQIAHNSLGSYICLKGYHDPDEIAELLPEYDIFCLPTVADSFGQVFLEAMSSGLPIICADIGGPKDVVIQNETGLLAEPDSLEDLVKMLEYAICNPEKMQEFGENGYVRAQKEYSLRSVAEKHLKIYKELLGE